MALQPSCSNVVYYVSAVNNLSCVVFCWKTLNLIGSPTAFYCELEILGR